MMGPKKYLKKNIYCFSTANFSLRKLKHNYANYTPCTVYAVIHNLAHLFKALIKN